MYAQQELHKARYSLAQYYLKQLQIASTLFRKGGSRTRQSLTRFDQDWGQIEQSQSWAAGRLDDEYAARLCCQFPAVGAELLIMQLSVSDQMRWLKPALAAAQQLGDPHAECDHLCLLSKAYWSAGEVDTAVEQLQRALMLAQSITYRAGIAQAHYHLCEIASHQARYDDAHQHAEVSLKLYEDLRDHKAYADVLLTWGFVDSTEGHYVDANRRYQQSLAIYRELGHQEGEATALARLGHMAGSQRDFALAQRYFMESHAIYSQLGHQSGIGYTLGMLGTVASCQGDYPTAREYYEKSLALHSRMGNQHGVAEAQQKIGEIAQYTGNFEEAFERYQQALDLYRSMNNRAQTAYLLMCLGNAMLNQARFTEAEQWFNEGVTISREIGRKTVLAISLKGLGQIAVHHERDYPRARQFFEQALAEAQANNDLWAGADVLDELGQLAVKMGQMNTAKHRLLEAVDTAYRIAVPSLILNHMASFAEYWAAAGQPTKALELAIFVRDHPATLETTKEDMLSFTDRLEAEISPDAAWAAADRVEAKDLHTIVKELREAARD